MVVRRRMPPARLHLQGWVGMMMLGEAASLRAGQTRSQASATKTLPGQPFGAVRRQWKADIHGRSARLPCDAADDIVSGRR